jgi:hypothetical protein
MNVGDQRAIRGATHMRTDQQPGIRPFGEVRQLQPMHMRTNTISRQRIALLL